MYRRGNRNMPCGMYSLGGLTTALQLRGDYLSRIERVKNARATSRVFSAFAFVAPQCCPGFRRWHGWPHFYVGAGLFGFLINRPVVSYYEAGTISALSQGCAALPGAFGMLAMALLAPGLTHVLADGQWVLPEKFVKLPFSCRSAAVFRFIKRGGYTYASTRSTHDRTSTY